MTSRECVLATLKHQEAGRAPIDFSRHQSSGMNTILYPKLREQLTVQLVKDRHNLKEKTDQVIEAFRVSKLKIYDLLDLDFNKN